MTRAGERGFTLIELLVSLAILGLVSAMLLAGLRMTGTAIANAQTRDTGASTIAGAQRLLRGRIERLRAVTRLDSATAIVDAEGTASEFSFYAPPLARQGPDALQRYRLRLTAGGDLTLYAASGLADRIDVGGRGVVGWTPLPLLTGARSLDLAYFGNNRNNGGRRWQSFWNSQPQPPELVRVRVTFAPGDERHWPELVIRPRATVNALCRIDELSGRCEDRS